MKIANIKAIVKERNLGKTIREIATEQRLSVGKVYNILRQDSGVKQ